MTNYKKNIDLIYSCLNGTTQKGKLSSAFSLIIAGSAAICWPEQVFARGSAGVAASPAVSVLSTLGVDSTSSGKATPHNNLKHSSKRMALQDIFIGAKELTKYGVPSYEAKHISSCREKSGIEKTFSDNAHTVWKIEKCLTESSTKALFTSSSITEAKTNGARDKKAEFILACQRQLNLNQDKVEENWAPINKIRNCVNDEIDKEIWQTIGKGLVFFGIPFLGVCGVITRKLEL